MSVFVKSFFWTFVVVGLLGPALAHNSKDHASPAQGASSEAYKISAKTYVVPDVVLIDSEAKPINLRELLAAKDPVMVNFIFTTCSAICPVMTKVFSDVPAKLGGQAKHLRMISISLDPERDTPRELKAYAKSFQAAERWKFLTGSTQDIKTVLLAFDSYRGDKMNHEPLTLMRRSPGKTWHRLDGFATPDELVREYRKVLQQ
jgi:protein SCO1/2